MANFFLKQILFSLMCMGQFLDNAVAQTNLSKKEIISYLHKNVEDMSKDQLVSAITLADSAFGRDLILELEYLRSHKIDSAIFYFVESPGYTSHDTCSGNGYPKHLYVLFAAAGVEYLDQLAGLCKVKRTKIESSKTYEYWERNMREILLDDIMPIVYSAKIDDKGKFSFATEIRSHEPVYQLFFMLNETVRRKEFTEADFFDKQNIFYMDNRESKLRTLFILMKKEIIRYK